MRDIPGKKRNPDEKVEVPFTILFIYLPEAGKSSGSSRNVTFDNR